MNSNTPVLLVDSNVLIEAHRRYYAFDICPGFWDSLESFHHEKRIFCIAQVRDEIMKGKKDELAEWAKKKAPDTFFPSTDNDEQVSEWYKKIIQWVQCEKFTQAAKEEYANSPDGWLIAYAKAKDFTIVSSESYQKDRLNKVKIPNVCLQFDIPCLDTFKMLRILNVCFKWDKR